MLFICVHRRSEGEIHSLSLHKTKPDVCTHHTHTHTCSRPTHRHTQSAAAVEAAAAAAAAALIYLCIVCACVRECVRACVCVCLRATEMINDLCQASRRNLHKPTKPEQSPAAELPRAARSVRFSSWPGARSAPQTNALGKLG